MSSEVRVFIPGNLTYRPPADNPEYRPGGVTALSMAPAPEDLPPTSRYFGKTEAECQKLALQSLAVISGLTGTFAAIKGGAERIFTIPITVLSVGGLLFVASTIKDYENPDELRAMQKEAATQLFSCTVEEHGLENTVTYLLNEGARQQKFGEEYASYSLSKVLEKHSFATIRKYTLASPYILRGCLRNELRSISVWDLKESLVTTCQEGGVLSPHEIDFLRTFIHQAKSYKDDYLAACGVVDRKYPERTSKLLEKLDLEAKKLPGEAERMKNTMLENGYQAAIEQAGNRLVVDTLCTRKPVGEHLRNYGDHIVQGCAVTVEAAAKTAQGWLTQKWTEIETKRKYILEQNFGGKEETSYKNELKRLEFEYKTNLRNLQGEFSVRVNELFGFI